MSLEVGLADLAASGVAVTSCGEELAAAHLAADSRVDGAILGWRGQSASALTSLVDQWTAATAGLLARLRDHASALHASASAFSAHQERSVVALESLR